MTATTDPQDERFDILNEHGIPTGNTKPRGLVHRDGDWHRSLHLWVYGPGNDGSPYILFQRRSMTKDTWPGKLDVAIGGHFRAGETLAETLREGEEEIGLHTTLADLVSLGRRFVDDRGPGFVDREVNEVYAVRSDRPLADYVQHPEEVAGIVAITIADLQRLFSEESETVPSREVSRSGAHLTPAIGLDDFAGGRGQYAIAVIASIESLVTGGQSEPFFLRETFS